MLKMKFFALEILWQVYLSFGHQHIFNFFYLQLRVESTKQLFVTKIRKYEVFQLSQQTPFKEIKGASISFTLSTILKVFEINPKYYFYKIVFSLSQLSISINKMSSDQNIQQLFSDGVSKKDFINHRDWYQKCSECYNIFDIITIPSLLVCGHFCCQICLKSTQNTECTLCTQKKVLKIRNYGQLIKENSRGDHKLYNFSITVNSKTIILSNQHQDTLLSSILNQHPNFQAFSTSQKQNMLIIIGSRNYLYSTHHNKPLSGIRNNLEGTNQILIQNKELGGTCK